MENQSNSEAEREQVENTSPPEVPAEPVTDGASEQEANPIDRGMSTSLPVQKDAPPSNAGTKPPGKRHSKKDDAGEVPKGVEKDLDPTTISMLDNRIDTPLEGEDFEELKEKTDAGEDVKRVNVYEDICTGERFADDGMLRQAVCIALGISLPVTVFKVHNARRYAEKEALKANAGNGRHRTRKELRAKIQKALDDEEWNKNCQAAIARLVGTSHTSVANEIRRRKAEQKATQGLASTAEELATQGGSTEADANREVEEVKGELVLCNLVEGVEVDKDGAFAALREELKRIRVDLEKLSQNENWVADEVAKETLDAIGKAARVLSLRKVEVPELDITSLKDFRRQHNLTMEELARLLGTTHATVSRWLDGKMKVSAHNQRAIKEAFLLDSAEIAEILERDGDA